MKLALRVTLPLLLLTAPQARAQDTSPPPDVLPLHRLELRPSAGWAFVRNSVTGAFVGADVAFRLDPRVALGLDAAWYGPFNRAPGTSPSYPLNEIRDSVDFDVSFYPWPARARSGAAAGAFEPYLVGALGALQSRPIAVVDPVDRSVDYNTLIDLGLGVGVRAFVAERVAFTLEFRDLVYFEKIENAAVAMGSASSPVLSPQNPALWYDAGTHVTNALQLRLGASFFVGP